MDSDSDESVRQQLEDLVGPVRVAEHAMALPAITTSANEVVTDSGIGKQVGMLQHADAKDRNVSTAFHFAGHHLLDFRDITRFLADATEGIQHVIMSTIPVRTVSVAAMNMIAIVEVALTAAPFLSEPRREIVSVQRTDKNMQRSQTQ